MKKRILSAALAVCMLLSLSLSAFAATASVSVDKPTVKAGEDVAAKAGVALFAMKGNAPVIPCAISGTYKFRSKLTIRYGEPLTLDEFRDKKLTTELMGEITKVIMDKVEELKVKE